jgi:hypothetical protein
VVVIETVKYGNCRNFEVSLAFIYQPQVSSPIEGGSTIFCLVVCQVKAGVVATLTQLEGRKRCRGVHS